MAVVIDAFSRQLIGWAMDGRMTGNSSSTRSPWRGSAATETLFGLLKVERLHGVRFETRRAAMDEVVDWLVFYNRKWLCSTLKCKSLAAFEEILRRQQPTLAA